MERNEKAKNKKMIEDLVKAERKKWEKLKEHQEQKKKKKIDNSKYNQYTTQESNQIRVLFLGESFSGKTSLINRFIHNIFIEEYSTTLDIQTFKSQIKFYENESYRLELVDTPPLEDFFINLDNVLYFVKAVILVFDFSNKDAYMRMQNYFKIIPFYQQQKIAIIATKKDLCKENEKYRYYQLEKFCKSYNATPCFVSSKYNYDDEINNFFDDFFPDIIPSLINAKKKLNIKYPYLKSEANKIPKINLIDEAIIREAKKNDSSYNGSECDKNQLMHVGGKKQMTEEAKKKQYIFRVGGKINYDDESISEGIKKKSFNEVIGDVNLDLEKAFKKYRPTSGDTIKSKKNNNDDKNKIKKKNERKFEDAAKEWEDYNIELLIEKFKNSDYDFNKKKDVKKQEDKKDIDVDVDKNLIEKEDNKVDEIISKKEEEKKLSEKEKSEKEKSEKEKSENEKESEKNINENVESEENSEEAKEYQKNADDYYENLYGDIYEFDQLERDRRQFLNENEKKDYEENDNLIKKNNKNKNQEDSEESDVGYGEDDADFD